MSENHLLQIKIDPEEKKKTLERRKRIEAKKRYQMARARYRSRWKVAVQVHDLHSDELKERGQTTRNRGKCREFSSSFRIE